MLRPTTARLHFLFRQCMALPKSWVNKALILLGCVCELDYVCLHVVLKASSRACCDDQRWLNVNFVVCNICALCCVDYSCCIRSHKASSGLSSEALKVETGIMLFFLYCQRLSWNDCDDLLLTLIWSMYYRCNPTSSTFSPQSEAFFILMKSCIFKNRISEYII